jgi:uncharacterized integral membrane protein (TIGR00698 family)
MPSGFRDVGPGLLVAVLIAGVSTGLGKLVPLIGGPVFGLLLGVILATVAPPLRSARLRPGILLASRGVLQTSIVVLGTGLSLRQVARVGGASLPVMLGTLTVALVGGAVLGRALRVRGDTQTLISVGTAICGASAIAATTAVIRAKDSVVSYAIGTIFTFNIAAVLLFPPLGHLLGLSPHAFGLWSGTAINDTSSVVAAGYSYGDAAGAYSIVVKLSRSLMLIPIVCVLALRTARRERPDAAWRLGGVPWRRVVPVFLVGFLAASALDSLGLVPAGWHPTLGQLGAFLITTALAGIGLSMRLSDIRRAGPRPLLLGALLWALVAVSGLGLQALVGTW